jgi:predicted 3-demethylubiquinone-9 3-methyltransferase (glyoxalase superfamily)
MKQITPNLWFDGNAKEAVDFYVSVFPDSKIISTEYYPKEGLADFQKDLAGKVLTVEFELSGNPFVAINAGPEFKFNEAISFSIPCKDQAEIDYYWEKLSKVPASEQCGCFVGRVIVYHNHFQRFNRLDGQSLEASLNLVFFVVSWYNYRYR